MNDSSLWHAILLGIIEGLTEFIPVSSTGHLIALIEILGFEGPPGKVFEIVIQLGAILAICWLYRARIWKATTGVFARSEDQKFALNIVLAFLPAAVIGVFAHSFIKQVLFSPHVVAAMLIVGGVLILVIERMKPEPVTNDIEQLHWRTALAIGFFQALAIIPGTSRSGATIMGALLLRVERKTATEFSFFLAIPTMLGATVYDLYKNWAVLDMSGGAVIAIGFISAFIAALLVVRSVIAFITRHGFVPFAWYRIVLGTLLLLWLA